ncbi:hypothetical protein D3C72_1829770 [compost metagenome]
MVEQHAARGRAQRNGHLDDGHQQASTGFRVMREGLGHPCPPPHRRGSRSQPPHAQQQRDNNRHISESDQRQGNRGHHDGNGDKGLVEAPLENTANEDGADKPGYSDRQQHERERRDLHVRHRLQKWPHVSEQRELPHEEQAAGRHAHGDITTPK